MTDSAESVIQSLKNLLSRYPQLELAAVFGSVAVGKADFDSDVDIAVQARRPLSEVEKIELIEAIGLQFNRPVDLIDVRTAGQPLLHQIVSTGIQVLGTRQKWGDLMFRNIMENEDFVPYQRLFWKADVKHGSTVSRSEAGVAQALYSAHRNQDSGGC